ncbi:MAG: hypothetical protein IPP82_12315 [Xanthomonadales bacterium]|nr:hypothetical protein [Xanthomonadales bacterium]
MANEKIIAANGVSDEDVAHIRLLIRKSAEQLLNAWRWGADAQADLLVVDTSNFAGQMARSRAKVTGMRFAVVRDADADHEGDPALIRPFKPENLVAVLNHATAAATGLKGQDRTSSGYFQNHSSEFEGIADLPDFKMMDDTAEHTPDDANVAPGLDELLKDHPSADPYLNLKPQKFDQSARVEGSGNPTRRSAQRADQDRESLAVPLSTPSSARVPERKQNLEDLSVYRLREFLEGELIHGPMQIAWPGAGALTLDPKNQVFHNADRLSDLEIYCRESSRLSDWRRLTTSEMNVLRESQPGQPYQKLIWLEVLLHSNGRLASNLDPGGTFQLTRWLEIARDYPIHARISAALMQPHRLHEIAASCECEMSAVFDVVNAYDAIGWLTWTARRSRHPEDDGEGKKSSFLSRLRKPFGKS